MTNYFEEYKKAKRCLYKMVLQFYSSSLRTEIADKYGIKYKPSDIKYKECIDVCYHDFEDEGLIAWEYLGIDKPYIPMEEMWQKETELKYEEPKDKINYYEKYLRICILLIDMVTRKYDHTITIEEADEEKVPYDKMIDVYDNNVEICDHLFEGAGEATWSLFGIGIQKNQIGKSIFYKKRDKYSEELLKIEYKNIKRLVKN